MKAKLHLNEVTLVELTSHVENWRVTARQTKEKTEYVFYRKGNAGNFDPVYTFPSLKKTYKKIGEISNRLKSYKRKTENAGSVITGKVIETLSNEAMQWIAKEKARQAKKSANAAYLDRIKKQAQAHKRHNSTDNGQSAKLVLADIWPSFIPATSTSKKEN